jgi:hypothetical protein
MENNEQNIIITKQEHDRLLKKAQRAEEIEMCLIKGHKWKISPGSDYCCDIAYCERCGAEERR